MGEHGGVKRLTDLPAGGRGVVRCLKGGKDFVARMAAFGFTTGTEVAVGQNYGHGPLIVSVRDTRVALGRGEAHKVMVEESVDGTGPENQQPG